MFAWLQLFREYHQKKQGEPLTLSLDSSLEFLYYKNDLLRLQGLVNLLILIFQVPFLFSFPLLIRLIGLLFGFWLLFKDIKYFHKLRLFFRFKFSYEADLLTMAYEQGLAHSKFM
ncbi:FtsK/SpoIIIE domain-containing protein, partial [Oenococcus kitaharae]